METMIWIWILLTVTVVSAAPIDRDHAKKSGCRRPVSTVVLRVKSDNIIDLTHSFHSEAPRWPSEPYGFKLIDIFTGYNQDFQSYFSIKQFAQQEHTGTHMDAPSHFQEAGQAADEVSLYSLIGVGVVVDLTKNGERFGGDSLVTIQHFVDWERENGGRIRTGSIVLLYTGFGDVYDNSTAYLGTNLTGMVGVRNLHFPGLHPDAAEWLVTHRCIAAVGIDTPSMEYGQTKGYRAHLFLTANEIPIFENVANLRKLTKLANDFKIIALPQKIRGATAGPLRIIAVTD